MMVINSQRPIDVVVAGHLCLDLIPRMGTVPLSALGSPGVLFEVDALDTSTGGAVSNTGLSLVRLGMNVRLMAAVGEDKIGDLTLQLLDERGSHLSGNIERVSGAPSSYTIVLSPQHVDRIFLHCTGTNGFFNSASIDYEALVDAKLFHLGYPPILPSLYTNQGEELVRIFQGAKAKGVMTSLDLSLPDATSTAGQAPWRQILARTLPFVDIFVPSIDEIIFMLHRNDFDRWQGRCAAHIDHAYLEKLANELLSMGSNIVGFKMGDRGLYLHGGSPVQIAQISQNVPVDVDQWAGHKNWHAAYDVHVVGTTGAGDSAYAGILTALLKGLSLADATQLACAVGGCNVEVPDAISGIRTYDDTVQRIRSGWKVVER